MLTGVAVLLLLLVALLAIPVALTYQLSWRQGFQGDIELQWAFGLVRTRLYPSQSESTHLEEELDGEEQAKKFEQQERSPRKNGSIFKAIGQKSFRRRVLRFLGDLWHALRKKGLTLRMRIGLGDPADTGQLWSVVGPVTGILSNMDELVLEVEPEFIESTFEVESSGNISFIPLQIIYLTIVMLLSPAIWHGIRQMRQRG